MDYYNQIAKGYDELHAEEQQKKLTIVKNHLKKHITIKKNTKILDIGCGTGESSNFECKVEGIDPSEELIKQAREKFPKNSYKKSKAEEFKFEKKYDLIISLTAIHHVKERPILFQKIKGHAPFFICSILKKSPQYQDIKKELEVFTLVEEIDEEKDTIMFLKS